LLHLIGRNFVNIYNKFFTNINFVIQLLKKPGFFRSIQRIFTLYKSGSVQDV
jgi:hypothetical protein